MTLPRNAITCLVADALCVAVIACALAACVAGCNGKATADFRKHEEHRDPSTGRVVWTQDTRATSAQELPPHSGAPTTQAVNADGITQSTAGQQEKPLAAYGVEQRQRIFYGGGVALIIGAALALYAGQKMLAVCVAGAGAVLIAVGMLAASPMLAAVSGLLLLVGLIWCAASWYRKHLENVSGITSALNLGPALSVEAIAALRETPIARHVRKAGNL